MIVYTRKFVLCFTDFLLINAAMAAALLLRFDGNIPVRYQEFIGTFIIFSAFILPIFKIFGMYSSLWRNAGIYELEKVLLATFCGITVIFGVGYISDMLFPRSAYIICWALTFLFVGGSRVSYRVIRRLVFKGKKPAEQKKRVMVIGAGDAGSMVIKEMKLHDNLKYEPVIAIDDDRWKHGSKIHGVPIIGGKEKIIEAVKQNGVDEIIVALPSVSKKRVSEILNICKKTRCKLKTLPGVYELIEGKVRIDQIREVNIEDLLGREEIKLNVEEAAGYLKDEVVLVTGGGGSIGSELCRQIARFEPKKLIIFDIYENSTYDLQNELLHAFRGKLDLEVVIGSVRDRKRLKEIFRIYRPGVVFHAAAHKHVPLMEANPAEAVKNNIFGTLNAAQCADEYEVKRFVLISTDKAVNPTNVMGATKRVAEMIIQAMDKHSQTEFVAVRFGNVLGSNGSVIPLFKRQIAEGGPVTVTHPEITRFFMTIPEAVSLVIQAGAMAEGGEIFILDMGQPVKIADLARDLIRLSGFEPEVDIKIEYTGLRPGEKLYEELLLAEEGIQSTRHEKIFIGKPLEISFDTLIKKLKMLEYNLGDPESIRESISQLVPTYYWAEEQVAVVRGVHAIRKATSVFLGDAKI